MQKNNIKITKDRFDDFRSTMHEIVDNKNTISSEDAGERNESPETLGRSNEKYHHNRNPTDRYISSN